MSGKSIGARVLRTEDARLLTGKGVFVDDIRSPGMLHAAFVRASFAHSLAACGVGLNCFASCWYSETGMPSCSMAHSCRPRTL